MVVRIVVPQRRQTSPCVAARQRAMSWARCGVTDRPEFAVASIESPSILTGVVDQSRPSRARGEPRGRTQGSHRGKQARYGETLMASRDVPPTRSL